MKRRIIAAGALCGALLLSGLPLAAPTPRNTTGDPAAQKNTRVQAPGVNAEYSSLLFPGLDGGAVTAVSVSSPDSSFEFLCKGRHQVSVNGSRADSEIFRTLVTQIAEITVSPGSPMPDGGELLLRLSVTAGGAQYDASFYSGGADSSRAYVVSGGSAPAWHQTAGWRVGTLMMTCEGTRIQDERGREPPAK